LEYIFDTLLALTSYWLLTEIPCCRNNRGECKIGELTIGIGKTIYKVCGHFKPAGKTFSEKLLRNMEKTLDKKADFCYNVDKSQKGLDCKQERII